MPELYHHVRLDQKAKKIQELCGHKREDWDSGTMEMKTASSMSDAGLGLNAVDIARDERQHAKLVIIDSWRYEERQASKPCNMYSAKSKGRPYRLASIESVCENISCGLPDELIKAGIRGLVVDCHNQMQVDWIVGALEAGIPVYCRQIPMLGSIDARRLVDVARKNDCLLSINFPCRRIKGMLELREHIRRGELGNISGLDITFRSRPGVVRDMYPEIAGRETLGLHLADLALWLFDYPEVAEKKIYMSGCESDRNKDGRQERQLARINLVEGPAIKLAYSNRVSSCDAAIDMGIYGNCDGDKYVGCNDRLFSFVMDSSVGVGGESEGGILNEWLEYICASRQYDPSIENYMHLTELMSCESGLSG